MIMYIRGDRYSVNDPFGESDGVLKCIKGKDDYLYFPTYLLCVLEQIMYWDSEDMF